MPSFLPDSLPGKCNLPHGYSTDREHTYPPAGARKHTQLEDASFSVSTANLSFPFCEIGQTSAPTGRGNGVTGSRSRASSTEWALSLLPAGRLRVWHILEISRTDHPMGTQAHQIPHNSTLAKNLGRHLVAGSMRQLRHQHSASRTPPTTRSLPAELGLGWIMEENKRQKDQSHPSPADGLNPRARKPAGMWLQGAACLRLEY